MSFFDLLGLDVEIVKTVLLLTGGMHGTRNMVHEYLKGFAKYVNILKWWMFRGILFLSFFLWSFALEISGFFISCSIITMPLHIIIILIITPASLSFATGMIGSGRTIKNHHIESSYPTIPK